MKNNLQVSLIVTTYKWPQALSLTLKSILTQTVKPGQIIIADDGSGSETQRVVADILGSSELRWLHVRHEDNKVRQSRIKNLAVKYSDQPYLIFIDHDTVLHPCFVEDHLGMAEEECFLQGKRVLLPGGYTQSMLNRNVFSPPSFRLRELGNRKNTLRIPSLGKLLSHQKGFQTSLRGCNLSMFRKNFLEVDGFDESFDQTWGREDSDICYRLFNKGVRIKNLWFCALQYHLQHRITENWHKERLDQLLENVLLNKKVKAVKGFSCLSSEGEIVSGSNKHYKSEYKYNNKVE